MHPFVETISIAGTLGAVLVAVIVVLTLFFRGLSRFSNPDTKLVTLAVRGILKPNTVVSVHLVGREVFERVRFIGFTRSGTGKTHLPFELNNLVILEDDQKQRYLVKAKNIRMIVVAPEANRGC